jgi:hypothetical protein
MDSVEIVIEPAALLGEDNGQPIGKSEKEAELAWLDEFLRINRLKFRMSKELWVFLRNNPVVMAANYAGPRNCDWYSLHAKLIKLVEEHMMRPEVEWADQQDTLEDHHSLRQQPAVYTIGDIWFVWRDFLAQLVRIVEPRSWLLLLAERERSCVLPNATQLDLRTTNGHERRLECFGQGDLLPAGWLDPESVNRLKKQAKKNALPLKERWEKSAHPQGGPMRKVLRRTAKAVTEGLVRALGTTRRVDCHRDKPKLWLTDDDRRVDFRITDLKDNAVYYGYFETVATDKASVRVAQALLLPHFQRFCKAEKGIYSPQDG